MKKKLLYWIILIPVFAGCSGNQQEESTDTALPTDTTATAPADTDVSTPAFTAENGQHTITNERYGFTFSVPEQYQVQDKSNNGDGYFIVTGDAGTDLRIYGTFIGDNPVAAELELASCEKTEKFRFGNGYPGVLCFQDGDRYYYYDTPSTRITFYVHASEAWVSRNAEIMQTIASSIQAGNY